MSFLWGMLGVIVGILLVIIIIGIIIFIIYSKIKKSVGQANMKQIINAAKNVQNYEEEEYTRIKNVCGMTKLLEPEIIRDFPDFNKQLLYSIEETSLRKIFNALENKSISEIKEDSELILIVPKIKEKIEDMKSTNTTVKYDDIIFHEHAIKKYLKKQGAAVIETSTTLEYYYYNSNNDKNKSSKKQTRYTCEFVYIYDESKFKSTQTVFTIHCPNCGAPIKNIKNQTCEYCTSTIKPINLKLWKMSSYKEDYK